MSDAGWQQVVMEKDPASMVPPDVAHVGPAPRTLTPALQAYIKKMKPSWAPFWIFVAAVSVVSYAGLLTSKDTAVAGIAAGLPWVGGSLGAAVWTYRRMKRGRAALRITLREGHLKFARLLENRQIQYGNGMKKRFKYVAAFEVEGHRVPFETWNDAMSMINRGQLVEVVFSPQSPGEIVPTFLLV